MSSAYTTISPARVRKDPLGHATLNQLHQNIAALDEVARVEHLSDGQHNATEIPWVLGHVVDGSPPTGYLFDTAFGGGTLARPATGSYTVNAVGGVVEDEDGTPLYSAMANVAGTAIEAKPHTITVEAVSTTSLKLRIRELSSALGAGNTWVDANRNFDFGLHSLAEDGSSSLLLPSTLLTREDYLTDEATSWNALVANHGTVRGASLLEHTSAGEHNVNRIAKGVVWVKLQSGPTYTTTFSEGVSSVTRLSTGVVEVLMSDTYAATTDMACFPEVQPGTLDDLCIINGRGFASGAGTSAFRFYIYAYSGGNWARADRSFFAAMFGAL